MELAIDSTLLDKYRKVNNFSSIPERSTHIHFVNVIMKFVHIWNTLHHAFDIGMNVKMNVTLTK